MFISVLIAVNLGYGIYGTNVYEAAVYDLYQRPCDAVWLAEIACVGLDQRKITPFIVRHLEVDDKAKDPLTGRLLLDEMRELRQSEEMVYIRFYRTKNSVKAIAVVKPGPENRPKPK